MYWNWKKGGLVLGMVFLLAVALVKPIGVSTQFVVLNAKIASVFYPELIIENEKSASGFSSKNPYLNKSGGKYAGAAANPLNYSFLFVLCMIPGGFIGRLLTDVERHPVRQIPRCHSSRFGEKSLLRYLLAFVGGFLVLLGARLAGGCTSGHMMSGMMQTAVSGYLFALAAFGAAVPVAILIYRKKEADHGD